MMWGSILVHLLGGRYTTMDTVAIGCLRGAIIRDVVKYVRLVRCETGQGDNSPARAGGSFSRGENLRRVPYAAARPRRKSSVLIADLHVPRVAVPEPETDPPRTVDEW